MDSIYISEEEEDEEEEEEDDDDRSSDESSFDSESDDQSQPLPSESEPTRDFCIEGTRLALPEGLCQDENIFNEFFSLEMWNNHLTSEHRTLLMKYLPSFPNNENGEKVITLRKIFTGVDFSFGNPMHKFFNQLKSGRFDVQTERLRLLRNRVQSQESKLQQQRRLHLTLKSLLASRKQNPKVAQLVAPSEILPRISRLAHVVKPTEAEERTRSRYFQELGRIRSSVGEYGHSDDELFPGGPLPGLGKKHKKQVAAAESTLKQEMPVVSSSLSDLKFAQVGSNPLDFNEKYYKKVISNYRKRKLKEAGHVEGNGLPRRNSQSGRKTPQKPPPAKKRKIKMEPLPTAPAPVKVANGSPATIFEEPSVRVKLEPGNIAVKQPVAAAKNAKVTNRRRSSTKSCSSGVASPIPATAIVKKEPVVIVKEKVVVVPEIPKAVPPDQSLPLARMAAPVTPVMPILQHLPEIAPLAASNATPSVISEDPVQTALDTNQILPNITFTPQEMEALELLNMSEFEEIVAQITAAPPSTTPPVVFTTSVAKPEHELNQEMHVCFFTLLRDIICSTQDQRMGLPSLTAKLQAWQESPISPLNDWFGLSPSWVDHLVSAINFLSGDFPAPVMNKTYFLAETQPEDFVPYLEYKPHMQAYQWIGAGRDSDHNLATLCSHWLDRRNEVSATALRDKDGVEDPNLLQPPPPRCPTNWQVRSATGAEREHFHIQEKDRYDNPNKAYTYRMHGYESVVGPVKGAYATSTALAKPRGHTLLVSERPNYVTILSLVRDAVARLPNGEGTRSEICVLLRDSQFMSPGAEENYLQSVVGGALDRLHYEADTCVKYDSKRKIWVYLHRSRTELEFEKMHQQHQGLPHKSKKASPRKNSRPPRVTKSKEPDSHPGGITIAHTANSDKSVEDMDKMIAEVVSTLSSEVHLPAPPPLQAQPVQKALAPTQTRVKAAVVNTTVTPAQRQFTVPAGSTLQNVQIATSTGLQTIQIAAPPKGGGTSLLTSSAAKLAKTAVKKPVVSAGNSQTLLTKRTVVTSPMSVVQSKPGINSSVTSTMASNIIIKSPLVSQTSTTAVNQTVTTSAPQVSATFQLIQKPPDNIRHLKRVDASQIQQLKLISATGLESQNAAQKTAAQTQFLTAKTVSQGIKVIPNTAVKNATIMAGQRPQAVYIKQAPQGGQQGMPTLIMNKSGALQMASPSTLKMAAGSNEKQVLTKLVAANAQGQLISLDSLTPSQQKQILAASASGTMRMAMAPAMAKSSPQVVHVDRLGGVPQLAVVSPGNMARPRLAQPQQVAQQLKTGGIRLINQSSSGFNIASIGGQQVILAGKPQTQGQNLILASGSGANQTVVLASPSAIRPQGGALVLQQGGTQQIVLPAGFQNIKTLQGNLQGIRVIPIAQASQANAGLPKGRQQVFARIISPTSRATTTTVTANLNKSVEGTKGVDGNAE